MSILGSKLWIQYHNWLKIKQYFREYSASPGWLPKLNEQAKITPHTMHTEKYSTCSSPLWKCDNPFCPIIHVIIPSLANLIQVHDVICAHIKLSMSYPCSIQFILYYFQVKHFILLGSGFVWSCCCSNPCNPVMVILPHEAAGHCCSLLFTAEACRISCSNLQVSFTPVHSAALQRQ